MIVSLPLCYTLPKYFEIIHHEDNTIQICDTQSEGTMNFIAMRHDDTSLQNNNIQIYYFVPVI